MDEKVNDGENWKKVNDVENCSFFVHVGKNNPKSPHKKAVQSCQDLMNSLQNIQKVFEKQTSQQVAKNQLQLKTAIDVVKWLTFQGIAFEDHDEPMDSIIQGNFIELLNLLGSYNEEVASVILETTSYSSPQTQEEILSIIAKKVQRKIRDDIGDSKFCIIMDGAQDEAGKEQMVIVLRFVDKEGFTRERLFEIIHVWDTTALNLKTQISDILSRHDLNIQNIRGQGYNGANNMQEEINGLQALVANESSFAYYVHCFAHHLQLTLVAASKVVIPVYHFFTYLNKLINVMSSSSKRYDQLTNARVAELEELISAGEFEIGKGKNLVSTLKRLGDTRWSSHFDSLCSLLELFDPICLVLEDIILDSNSPDLRAEAYDICNVITSFDFIFHLHLLKDVFEISNMLCQALQQKSQDILNVMHLVSTTKARLHQMRENEWDSLFGKVKSFCEKCQIDVPNMSAYYGVGKASFRRRKDLITVEHHYKADIFLAVIDTQLQEIGSRFKDEVVELLILYCAMDPRDNYKSFNIADICLLASKFYPMDFSEQEKLHLKVQLELFKLDVDQNPTLQKVSTISELCQVLAATRKSTVYPLFDRLIRLVLTLPVFIASTERAFSAMEIIKSVLQNKMGDNFLLSSLVAYIEEDIARSFDTNSIIDDFDCKKE